MLPLPDSSAQRYWPAGGDIDPHQDRLTIRIQRLGFARRIDGAMVEGETAIADAFGGKCTLTRVSSNEGETICSCET